MIGAGLLVATAALAGPALALPDPGKTTGKPDTTGSGNSSTAPVVSTPSVGGGSGAANGNGAGNGAPATTTASTTASTTAPGTGGGAASGNGSGSGAGNGGIGIVVPPIWNLDPDVAIEVRASGPVPDDLDHAGATFTLTNVHVPGVKATCTTDSAGTCTLVHDFLALGVDESAAGHTLHLPAGSYAVEQTAASPGLQIADGHLGTVALCGYFSACHQPDDLVVSNDSLFRTTVVTTVKDGTSDAGIPDAAYTLSGPDYPHAGSAEGSVLEATVSSDAAGVLVHRGWFLPDTWTLEPGAPPAGYEPDERREVPISTTPGQAAAQEPVVVEVLLSAVALPEAEVLPPEVPPIVPPVEKPVPDGTPVVVPEPPVVPDPDGAPVPEVPIVNPGPVVDPGGGTGTTTGTGTRPSGTSAGAGAGTAGTNPPAGRNAGAGGAAAAAGDDVTATGDQPTSPSTSRPATAGAPASGSSTPVLADDVEVTGLTPASSSISAAGLLGFAILLIAAVVVGTRLVLRRARGRA